MSQIYELFGYPLDDRSQEAEASRRQALCPFMQATCDGGGNRHQSKINLSDVTVSDELKTYFADLDTVQSGICSLQLKVEEPPWIVCPRRLLALGKSKQTLPANQANVISPLIKYAGFTEHTRIGIWSEPWLRYSTTSEDSEDDGIFNYRFDYILMPLGTVSASEAEDYAQIEWHTLRKSLISAGYSLTIKSDVEYVEDFPVAYPIIIEIMTSSTSGGNKTKRTTIPMAFEDAILDNPHQAPTINYRQVWARMVSQLIAKSQVGIAWGGKTIWVLQDNLVNYINTTTGLDIYNFLSEKTDEVNILSFSYSEYSKNSDNVIELDLHGLFSGSMKPKFEGINLPSFQDIIQIGTIPPRYILIQRLIQSYPAILDI